MTAYLNLSINLSVCLYFSILGQNWHTVISDLVKKDIVRKRQQRARGKSTHRLDNQNNYWKNYDNNKNNTTTTVTDTSSSKSFGGVYMSPRGQHVNFFEGDNNDDT